LQEVGRYLSRRLKIASVDVFVRVNRFGPVIDNPKRYPRVIDRDPKIDFVC